MLLKSVHLRNIRSYSNEEIKLPLGSTLLAGDIGSGKSTILMAVDFALFGIRKGEISGSDLLRHGSDTGQIDLEMEIEGKPVSITRVLKRKKDSINQEAGFLSVDGFRKEYTPTEMTAEILQMIGYPQEVLKKNRPIFRYTVYTPQEEMKSIIEGENRIETMRKIFDIDKYGVIKGNSSALVSFVRGEKRNLEGYTQDLEELKKETAEKLQMKEKSLADLKKHERTVHEIENELLAKRNDIEKSRKELQKFLELKKGIENKEMMKAGKSERLARNSKEISDLNSRIALNKATLEKYAYLKKPSLTLSEIKAFSEEAENEKDSLLSQKSRALTHLDNIRKIYSRGICETCGQPVHDREKFAATIKANENLCSELEEKLGEATKKIAELKKMEVDCRDYDHGIQRKSDIDSAITDLENRFSRLSSENTDIEKEVEILEKELKLLEESVSGADEIEKLLKRQEKEYQDTGLLYAAEKRKQGSIEAQLAELEKAVDKLQKEIEEKEDARKKIERLNELVNWLNSSFAGMMDSMERHVMIAIQREFNEYFQEWFSILMSDVLSVRIDENFSPVIEQNGYETEYRNLSGGEKTSVALAYRLAMNKVINDLIHSIKTKDLLILDEPTDGFSTDQLDRIRDVLAILKLKQVIIVSHEPKIDTYVDNVIRIYKEDHISRAAQ